MDINSPLLKIYNKGMDVSRALRFINPEKGPITHIVTAPYPGIFRRRFWHSTAHLINGPSGVSSGFKVMNDCGGGWSRSRELSQLKAVVEAVERWAYRTYSAADPAAAALDKDPNSNGFAAMPGPDTEGLAAAHAYCEALERFLLDRLWPAGLKMNRSVGIDGQISGLFKAFGGVPAVYELAFEAEFPACGGRRGFFFFLCLFKTEAGGVIPGSACSLEAEGGRERAMFECYNHCRAFELMAKAGGGLENILEKRLYKFASSGGYFDKIAGKLEAGGFEVPAVSFSRRLPGPWDPDITVHRVLLEGAAPLNDGGLERFII